MAASVPEGWVFTATIPSWTQTTLQGDEAVVVRTSCSALLSS